MKKIIVALSVLVTLSAGSAMAQQKTAAKPKAAAKTETSIVGKWHLVDAKFKQTPPNTTPEQIKESMEKENMVYEFTADGKVKATSKSGTDEGGTYTRSGNKLMIKDAKTNESQSMMIKSLTDKELQMGMDDAMTMVFEKI